MAMMVMPSRQAARAARSQVGVGRLDGVELVGVRREEVARRTTRREDFDQMERVAAAEAAQQGVERRAVVEHRVERKVRAEAVDDGAEICSEPVARDEGLVDVARVAAQRVGPVARDVGAEAAHRVDDVAKVDGDVGFAVVERREVPLDEVRVPKHEDRAHDPQRVEVARVRAARLAGEIQQILVVDVAVVREVLRAERGRAVVRGQQRGVGLDHRGVVVQPVPLARHGRRVPQRPRAVLLGDDLDVEDVGVLPRLDDGRPPAPRAHVAETLRRTRHGAAPQRARNAVGPPGKCRAFS
mmetsp:Transcript_23647/g.93769  ORF Transcript_23647/g.93769 Transcript_23647/m.93769 type:complete len:298 (-) Transcript_23647:618-1511(-)